MNTHIAKPQKIENAFGIRVLNMDDAEQWMTPEDYAARQRMIAANARMRRKVERRPQK